MTKIKICGNTDPKDAALAAELGADYLGIIFTESKRQVSLGTAKNIMQAVPGFKNFVGVFVNEPKANVDRIASELKLNFLQFHGDETALYCKHFMDKGFCVIKAFRVKDAMSLKRIDEYDVTAFLFDAFSKEASGGTGAAFNWNLIEDKPYIHEKLFLAGGLNPDNVREAIEKVHPYAVDVASGVEKETGKKDAELLKAFISEIKKERTKHAKKGSLR